MVPSPLFPGPHGLKPMERPRRCAAFSASAPQASRAARPLSRRQAHRGSRQRRQKGLYHHVAEQFCSRLAIASGLSGPRAACSGLYPLRRNVMMVGGNPRAARARTSEWWRSIAGAYALAGLFSAVSAALLARPSFAGARGRPGIASPAPSSCRAPERLVKADQ